MARKEHVDFNASERFLRYKDYPSVVQSKGILVPMVAAL